MTIFRKQNTDQMVVKAYYMRQAIYLKAMVDGIKSLKPAEIRIFNEYIKQAKGNNNEKTVFYNQHTKRGLSS